MSSLGPRDRKSLRRFTFADGRPRRRSGIPTSAPTMYWPVFRPVKTGGKPPLPNPFRCNTYKNQGVGIRSYN
jgi:hypothetical protein